MFMRCSFVFHKISAVFSINEGTHAIPTNNKRPVNDSRYLRGD